jgi:hypothetical protein
VQYYRRCTWGIPRNSACPPPRSYPQAPLTQGRAHLKASTPADRLVNYETERLAHFGNDEVAGTGRAVFSPRNLDCETVPLRDCLRCAGRSGYPPEALISGIVRHRAEGGEGKAFPTPMPRLFVYVHCMEGHTVFPLVTGKVSGNNHRPTETVKLFLMVDS